MTQFLAETLIWTGALIALVLLVRRPVARLFGPQAAYALWALPALRLIMPPITLPAWLGPAQPSEAMAASAAADGGTAAAGVNGAELTDITSGEVIRTNGDGAASFLSGGMEPVTAISGDLLLPLVVGIWLCGAGVFLVRRFGLYFAMRRDLLAEARNVGHEGKVRLVETPAVGGPVAFGIIDKVIALPAGFMAMKDRTARDLALEHELAHHRAGDLLANLLVQPLFALHWFSPLGAAGWRAMRRDQEAACDARVLAKRPEDERAIYAGVIAELATGSGGRAGLALAAPMACPVLGDKSIIHRLKTIAKSDIPEGRRKLGAGLLVGGMLILPMTASISFAEPIQSEGERAAAPQPPVPPVPSVTAAPPAAPNASLEAPQPPEPPAAPEMEHELERIIEEDRDAREIDMEMIERELEKAEQELERVEQDIEREIERERGAARAGPSGQSGPQADGRTRGRHYSVRRSVVIDRLGNVTTETLEEVRDGLRDVRRQFSEDGNLRREMRLALAHAQSEKPSIVVECQEGQTEPAASQRSADGSHTIFLCKSAIAQTARTAVAGARQAISRDRNLSIEEKAEALRSIDEALADLEDGA